MRKKCQGAEIMSWKDRAFYTVSAAVIITCLIVKIFFCPVIVTGNSMAPTLRDRQVVRTERVTGCDDIERGDIIVIKSSATGYAFFIKRCVAVPGDVVDIRDGILYVNGEPEAGAYPQMMSPGDLAYPVILSEDEFFCLGDNRNNSRDSRQIGPVLIDDIKYRVKT